MCDLQSVSRVLNLAFIQTLYEISVMSTDSPDNGSEGGQKRSEKRPVAQYKKKQTKITTFWIKKVIY